MPERDLVLMVLSAETRDWWWSFLEITLTGELLPNRLIEHRHLNADYRERPGMYQAIFRPGSSIRAIFTALLHRLRGLKIERIFILVDEMDSYLEMQDLAGLAAVVKPLLNTSPLLSLPGLVWKFFLPDQLAHIVYSSSGYRTGRLRLAPIVWSGNNSTMDSAQELAKLLRQRLKWASAGKIADIDELGSLELTRDVRIEQALVEQALRHRRLGPPRALLALGSQLFEVMQGQQLSLAEWNAFMQRVQHDMDR